MTPHGYGDPGEQCKAIAAAGGLAGSEAPKGKCDVCSKETEQRCSRCKVARFCSGVCLKQAWPTHKAVCKAPPSGGGAKDGEGGAGSGGQENKASGGGAKAKKKKGKRK